ncbi:MAG: hypothetical protein JO257_37520 [Deltaproteobacteria bacterium]|nr:hypothetical protein [Deltaproteobacteria bacterium]
MRQLPLALLLASAACVDQAPASTDNSSTAQSAIEQSNGGETTADEAPMFGDQVAFDAMSIEADTAVSDSMASDPGVTTIAAAPDVASHRLVIAWGKLPADPNGVARDWSGSLTISRGALVVSRTIGFEAATDHLDPRTSKDSVSFASITKPFVDGLALRVLDPTPSSADPLTLTYAPANGGASYTLDLAQLATGPLVVDAGDGFKIVAAALRDHDGCEHGFMRGRWHQLLPNLGVYRGLVVGPEGAVIGHVRGIYGQRKNGDRVLFGKFIDDAGRFKGILAGTYGGGDFQAKWIAKDGDHGIIKGKYVESADVRGGMFAARWADAACAQ